MHAAVEDDCDLVGSDLFQISSQQEQELVCRVLQHDFLGRRCQQGLHLDNDIFTKALQAASHPSKQVVTCVCHSAEIFHLHRESGKNFRC